MKRLLKVIGGIVVACFALSVVAALIGGGAPAAAPSTPAVTQASQPEASPTPAPSGGIGLPLADWEKGKTITGKDAIGFTIYDGEIHAMAQSGNVWHVELWKPESAKFKPADAEAWAATQLPSDTQQVKRYSPDGRPETTVIVYKSEWLATRFDPKLFGDDAPGTLAVQYNTFDFGVSRVIVALGDNP